MKENLVPMICCPKCKSLLQLEEKRKTKERIHTGKLYCKKCNSTFKIVKDIVCFKRITRKKKEISKMKGLFLGQEFKKEWQKHFTKKELSALKKEWKWMVENLNLEKSKIHLDWGTGTGRFLREILDKVEGEVVALEIDYPTCLGLKMFLKKLGKYSQVTIIYGDARNMPFCSNSVDSISSWHGLDEPKINKAIDESKRILKPNKKIALSGLFYEKGSESLKIAKKERVNFAEENKALQYFKKLNFKDIKYKVFFEREWSLQDSFLPRIGDRYTVYGINGTKR